MEFRDFVIKHADIDFLLIAKIDEEVSDHFLLRITEQTGSYLDELKSGIIEGVTPTVKQYLITLADMMDVEGKELAESYGEYFLVGLAKLIMDTDMRGFTGGTDAHEETRGEIREFLDYLSNKGMHIDYIFDLDTQPNKFLVHEMRISGEEYKEVTNRMQDYIRTEDNKGK